MKSRQKFFKCGSCGNMVGLIENKGAPLLCCGGKMAELVPNTVEASTEKHLPVVTVAENSVTVSVGSVPHPMEAAHNIAFVYVETKRGGQRKTLKPGEKPTVEFVLVDDEPIAVYAFCNLHGLWRTELKG